MNKYIKIFDAYNKCEIQYIILSLLSASKKILLTAKTVFQLIN